MAAYEYRCRECQSVFEVRRSMSESAPATVSCPVGHTDTTRVFSALAVTGVGGSGGGAPAPVPAGGGGGGCCGGGCCG